MSISGAERRSRSQGKSIEILEQKKEHIYMEWQAEKYF
jgi:hypothetical protein